MRTTQVKVLTSDTKPRSFGDRVLWYAVVGSIILHVAVLGIVGRTSAARMASPALAKVPRYIKVELLDYNKPAPKPRQVPRTDPSKPAPVKQLNDRPQPVVDHVQPFSIPPPPSAPRAPQPGKTVSAQPPRPAPSPYRVPGNPGGKIDVGSTSAGGDLGGNWDGGRTQVGHVSGSDNGRGQGSGSGAGVAPADPVKNATEGPGTHAAPPPPPPPPPVQMVSRKVCAESGMLAGDNCKRAKTDSFVEGKQPTRTCDKCQPEFKSRIADRADPVLTRNSVPSIPGSVEEGLSVTVEIRYTVTADGDVADIDVIKSSGNKVIDRAVVNSAKNLKYKPAVQDGVPRSVKKVREYSINT